MKADTRARLLELMGAKFILSILAMALIAGASAFSRVDPTMGILYALGIFSGANVGALFVTKSSRRK